MTSEDPESLRVLMVDSERAWRGGQAQLHLLMRGLLDQGVTVQLAAPPDSESFRRGQELNVPLHPLPIAGGLDVVSAWRLRRVIKRSRFDVVHSHASHAHSVAYMACATLKPRPSQVVSRRVGFAVATNRLSGAKYRHGADLYLAISNGVRDVLVECGVPKERIRLVPSGIDVEKIERFRGGDRARAEFDIAGKTLVVGNVAALTANKGQVDFIRAARVVADRFPGTRFFVVGEGEMRSELEALVRELKLDGVVVFTGFREDRLEIMSMFTCFVLSSYLEGLGTSIMDAQAMGIPVVATDTGGVPDIVEDGVTGLLVPPGDANALAQAIVRLLEDEGLKQHLAKKALAQSRGYDYRQMVYKTLDAYRELAGGRVTKKE
jgi:glycosyltransferase involved in cell wall biosynthesis